MALNLLHPAGNCFTGVSSEERQPVIGQMRLYPGEQSARLCYLLPAWAADSTAALRLLDGLSWQAGSAGAFRLLAEVDETHAVFEALRQAGFSVYAWQRIWQFPALTAGSSPALWQAEGTLERTALQSLYQSLVPPLVQSAEPFPTYMENGLVYRRGSEVLAFCEVLTGGRGVYLKPLIHPDLENQAELLGSLAHQAAGFGGRPVYLAVRSYQAWLESALEQLPAQVSPRRALLVKHLVKVQRVPVKNAQFVVEARHAEPTASISPHASLAGEAENPT